MKTPLSETEQDDLRKRGILNQNEIAYRENNLIFAEDAINGKKRVINVTQMFNESKNLLLG